MSHPKESAPRQTNGLGTSGHPRNLAQLAAKKAELKAELKAAQRRTRMNKTLISIEKLKQIALSEIHTFPGCEDVSAVGIYPVTDEVVESNWSVQVVSGEGGDPKPQTALRFTLSTSFVTRLTG